MTIDIPQLEAVDIPLNKLIAWEGNVRSASPASNLEELTAGMVSLGVLQSVVVMKAPRGKYFVVAGERRRAAFAQLAEAGSISAKFPVPCRILPDGVDPLEVSLAENVMREPMHPADEFEAWRKLIASGKSIADVAARFGVTDAVVNRRLALARVSPVLLERYRSGEMNLNLLQAFTLTDDCRLQEQVWDSLQTWDRNPDAVRRMLSADDIPADDKRVRFVGLANYEADAGIVKRDLFSQDEEEDGVYIADPGKLTRLANERLQRIADRVKADGWNWVEIQPDLDHAAIAKLRRMQPTVSPLTEEAQSEFDALSAERDRIQERFDTGEEGVDPEEEEILSNRMDVIEARIGAIEDTRRTYPQEIKSTCGVVVSIGHEGSPKLSYGLLRKEDETALRKSIPAESASPASAAPKADNAETSQYSAALIESLTTHKTAAIAVELARQPTVALSAVAHAMVLSVFGLDLHLYRSASALQLSASQTNLSQADDSPAFKALDKQRQDWQSRLPTKSGELWQWCLDADKDTLLQLLAFCAALSVNGIATKNDAHRRSGVPHSNALAAALKIDMTRWFAPTAENFFDKISKARIAAVLTEAGKAPDAAKLALKKPQFAKVGESEIAGTGWLPEPVRIALMSDDEPPYLSDEYDEDAEPLDPVDDDDEGADS